MMALSRTVAVQTYMLTGMALAFLRMAEGTHYLLPPRLGVGLLAKAGAVNVLLLGALYAFVRLFAQYQH
jgi:hypothetical protein